VTIVQRRRYTRTDVILAAEKRNVMSQHWIRVVSRLPAGRVEELWNSDGLTVDEVLDAWHIRSKAGLEP
jgi:hypothetical protein